MVFNGILISTVIIALLTVLPFWRHEAWWVRSLDFPRLQLFCTSFVLLLMEILLLDISGPKVWLVFGLSLSCFIYHAWWIAPYTRLWSPEVKAAKSADRRRSIRVMTANVLMTNRDAEALLEHVHANSPDVLVALETDAWWQSKLDLLESDYVYTIKCPLDNFYGMHVYSRFQLIDSSIEYLVEPDIPSMHTVLVMPAGDRIRMHFLHPAPPSPTENQESSERDAELIVVAKSVAETDRPVIVTGDLNDVAWSETTRLFRKISGLLDPRVGRGMFNTFHAGYWFIRWPLDHLFHSRHFLLSQMIRLPRFGSDHFAIMTELVLSPECAVEQDGLEADHADVAWARDKMINQKVDKEDVPHPE